MPEPSPHPTPPRFVGLVSRYFPYGWLVVSACFLAQAMTAIASQGLSTYILPLQREFGWSASATAAGRSFQAVDNFLGPLNGWLLHRFGPRRIMTAGAATYVLSFAVFSVADSLVIYYAACLMMAAANSLVGLLAVSVTVVNWFHRKRATAMGVAVAGFAVGGMLFIPLVVWMQAAYGWRGAALLTGVLAIAIGAPIALFVRDAPEPLGLRPDGGAALADTSAAAAPPAPTLDFTVGAALRTPAFWLLTASHTLINVGLAGLTVHQFAYLELAVSRETAALALVAMNGFNVAGRLVGGVLGDRFARKNRLLSAGFLVSGLAVVLLVAAPTFLPALFAFAALFGFTWGMRVALMNPLFGDYFGRAAFGRIVGISQTIAAGPVIVAPVVIGLMFDVTGDYRLPFLVLAALMVAAAATCFSATRPGAQRLSVL